ncbi:rod shape-determining protein RodA [Microbulbifer sp. 2205BS26-8]|uniref:rod shape-determining protein RodA n=1 Tax=Microbulbifer sp. 2205BS26-8 TaxID=3064386 RepID=UPI00273F6521|nr:rod shape-determining protein RodA [Microbulbifer sp. 2205BS26-8]MDP5210527.1 rod shape-determining protein RodA [Microbulbifer sp. 2205BS26-8]
MANRDYSHRLSDMDSSLRKPVSLARRLHLDVPLLVLLLLLASAGLGVLYSASGGDFKYVQRQSVFMCLAFLGMFIVAQIPLDFYRRWSIWAYLGGCTLLLGVLFFGTGAKGAQRWLEIGGFRFQPSEMMKLGVPMMVAAFLYQRAQPPAFATVCGALVIVAVPAALIVRQPDLGTAILIAAAGLFALYLAGLSWKMIGAVTAALMASTWPIWQWGLRDYQRQRILTLLNPHDDRFGAGWNIFNSKAAIGSGGVYGKGYLQGTQSQLDFLPESHTDFIIAVLAEEWGMRGVLILLLLYVLVIARGIYISFMAQYLFGRLLAGSITLTFFVYVFVNIGMVTGLLPIVGVPLPMISYGGTSLITLMAGFGILMAVGTERRRVHF